MWYKSLVELLVLDYVSVMFIQPLLTCVFLTGPERAASNVLLITVVREERWNSSTALAAGELQTLHVCQIQ